jgi:hypothetical protein
VLLPDLTDLIQDATMNLGCLVGCIALWSSLTAAGPGDSVLFEAPKYGLKAEIPKDWPIAQHEKDDRIFVALVPQSNPEQPGVAACELGLAPENLDEYRSRIDRNAQRGDRPHWALIRNEVVRDPKTGEPRLETMWAIRRPGAKPWRELSVRRLAHRQMYTFILNVEEATLPHVQAEFDTLVASVVLSPPNTGADRIDKTKNRWAQREFKFALDLPEGWEPALAPEEIALFYANGPAHGIWADNVLVVAHPSGPLDLQRIAREFPEQLLAADKNCEVLSCKVIDQNSRKALETVVRTRRGPFSMTILERRFKGDRFDYETKYTVESERFDKLAPQLRRSLDSFSELPGDVPALGTSKPA